MPAEGRPAFCQDAQLRWKMAHSERAFGEVSSEIWRQSRNLFCINLT